MRCSGLGLALLASACAGAGAFQIPHVHAPAAGARGGILPQLVRRQGVHRHYETAGRPLLRAVRARGPGLISAQASAAPGAAQFNEVAYQLLGLGGLDEAEVDGLLSIAEVATAKPGAVLSKNDAITSSAYDDKIVLLLSGSATIMRAGERDRDLRPGDFVGEEEFLQLEVTQKLLALTSSPLEDFFRATDTDASGSLDAGEVRAALRKQGIDISEEQALKLIAVIDLDADGNVSLDELKTFADSLQQRALVRDLFLKIDKDGSGAVDASEIAFALNVYLNTDFTAKQAQQVLGAITGSASGRCLLAV